MKVGGQNVAQKMEEEMPSMGIACDIDTEDTEEEQAAIGRVRAAREALAERVVILGHHYQRDSVIQFADFQGDSFKLSQEGAKVSAKAIVFAGVHFMAESAVILGRPDQVVILPDLKAGCSMADMATPEQVLAAWEVLGTVFGGDPAAHVMPITYMNSAAALKAFVGENGGAVCTSSNARGALEWAFGQRERVFFFPDQHLGRNTAKAMGIPLDEMPLWERGKPNGGLTDEAIRRARVILWDGYCGVHQGFFPQHIDFWRKRHPDITVIVHPECMMEVVDKADLSGSTGGIIKAVDGAPVGSKWAIGTEIHLVNRLKKRHPDKLVVSLSPHACACSTMFRISPIDLAKVLEGLLEGRVINQIAVPDEIKVNARLALDRMLAIPR
jgi:quinolinate synthase